MAVLNGAIMQRSYVIQWSITFFRKYFWTNLIWGGFGDFGHFRAKQCVNCLKFFPSLKFKLKWSHYAKIGYYLMTFFRKYFGSNLILGVFWQIWLFLATLRPKTANYLNYFPSLKFKSKMDPLLNNWILSDNSFHF